MTPSKVEIVQGPRGCRIILREDEGGYGAAFDAEGDGVWINSPMGGQLYATRAWAISNASRKIREGLANRITPAVTAWLAALASPQLDLFAA